jgi:hypothetical protein
MSLLASLDSDRLSIAALSIVRAHLKRMRRDVERRHTDAIHEILFVHGAGAVNAYWRLELP